MNRELLSDLQLPDFGEIVSFFGPSAATKARSLTGPRVVLDLVENPEDEMYTVEGSVPSSSGQGFYEVSVAVDDEGEIISSRCECPVRIDCKHGAAALLTLIAMKRQNLEPGDNGAVLPPADTPPENPLKAPLEEKRVLIAKKKPQPPAIRTIVPCMSNPAKNMDRWELVAVIVYGSMSGQSGAQPSFFFIPKNRYVKKSGAPGRLADYAPSNVTETPDPRLLSLFASGESAHDTPSPVALHRVMRLVLGKESPRLYLHGAEGGNDSIPLRPLEIRHVSISFKPDAWDEKGKRISYRAMPAFEGEGAAANDRRPESLQISLEGARFFALAPTGALWWSDDASLASPAFARAFNRHAFPDSAALSEWKDAILSSADSIIDFTGIPEEEILVKSRPSPLIEIADTRIFTRGAGTGCAFRFVWKYGAVSFAETDRDAYRVANDEFVPGQVLVYARDRKAEEACEKYAAWVMKEDIMPVQNTWDLPKGYRRFLTVDPREFIVRHAINLLSEGFGVKLESMSDPLHAGKKISVGVKTGMDWFEVKVDADGFPVHFNTGEFDLDGTLLFSNGKTYILDPNDARLLERLKALSDDKTGEVCVDKRNLALVDELSQVAAAMDAETGTALAAAKEMADKLRAAATRAPGLAEKKLPRGFKAELRPYQKTGYDWLFALDSTGLCGILADDMGLGKTVQTLAFLLKLKQDKGSAPNLVVAPVTTLPNWESEAARFAPSLKVLRHHGQERDKTCGKLSDYDLVLTSYRTLDIDIGQFEGTQFRYLVLDEAQTIKNAETRAFKTVKRIKADARLSLSGTPIENRTAELWSQMDFLNPGLMGTKADFRRRFELPVEKGDEDASALLGRIAAPFILRRKKADVLDDLPPKEEIILRAELDSRQRSFYESVRETCKNSVAGFIAEHGAARSGVTVFEALLRLRQAALFPGMVNRERESLGSAKLDLFDETLGELLAEGHEVLVFSQFTTVLDRIGTFLDKKDITYARIDGSTKDRASQIKSFGSETGKRVFLLSLKAGGVGINLTAADSVIVFDPWWNPAAESQAIDRAYRIGQKRAVTAFRLIVADTVEEKMLSLQEHKREIAERIIDTDSGDGAGPAGFLSGLDAEEILSLFE